VEIQRQMIVVQALPKSVVRNYPKRNVHHWPQLLGIRRKRFAWLPTASIKCLPEGRPRRK
jgi:hypothetical protein